MGNAIIHVEMMLFFNPPPRRSSPCLAGGSGCSLGRAEERGLAGGTEAMRGARRSSPRSRRPRRREEGAPREASSRRGASGGWKGGFGDAIRETSPKLPAKGSGGQRPAGSLQLGSERSGDAPATSV